ncbi:MAG: Gfo/Idh/MocA family oxidoreductase, partial [Phycisphaerae bacterium]|nr:Gfo/Idh/MocA family oxidoreductase [Phycisphaerae bacterium]
RLHFAHILNKAGRGWYGEIDCGGGIVRESSTHSIDLFRWLVGDVAAVCGQAGTFGEQMTDAEDSAAYLLRSTNGALGVIDVSWATPVSQNRVEIYGADGSIVVDIDQRKATCRTIDGGEEVFSGEPAMAADRVYCEIDLLIDVIAGQAKPLVTAVDGVRAVEVAEAVMKSIKTKRWVQL